MNAPGPAPPPTAARLRRLVRTLVNAVEEMNTTQAAMFESYLRYDRYLLEPPGNELLHWEPDMPGWVLRGEYLPPCPDDRSPPCPS